ncbi:centrosome-associated protein ALMS1 [Lampris incognitus]|uniref:centrosome-associated protein ALMS1 n=1 Tax=Lampris incognitus TaxID=2546036 RepID=UPI0024B5147E|nr:centrosome-associated protein ALMS1 [Lampris incognitus]
MPEGKTASTFPQSFTPTQRLAASQRPLAIQAPALPILLPYRPHGSKELFYVPQTETQMTPDRSDTTMESSHPGSDDAVPPHFSSEVLGNQDPGLDRGVTVKHTEGIYSKRRKTASFKMQTPGHRGNTVSVDESCQTSMIQTPQRFSQDPFNLTKVPLSSDQAPSGSKRDQGTSPVQFLSCNQSDESGVEFQPINMEIDYSMASQSQNAHLDQSRVSQTGMVGQQESRYRDLGQPATQQNGGNLDQLWRRFSERWRLEESHWTNEKEASLLERLERLSRLIHNTTGATRLLEPEDGDGPRKTGVGVERIENIEKSARSGETRRKADGKLRGDRKVDVKPTAPRRAWVQETQAEEIFDPAEEESSASLSSSASHSPSTSRHLCPAERDESETASTMCSSTSTVDTARLIQAFGVHRVRCLTSSSSLTKLYSDIDKQREGRDLGKQRGKAKDLPPVITQLETTTTDESVVTADCASSASTHSSHHGPSQSLAAKRVVKLANKGIQAGDLEIVNNGTRRHTRDVGTIFPSPGDIRGTVWVSLPSSSIERGPSKTQVFLKDRRTKRDQAKHHPQGVSWFIPVELRAEGRKENKPDQEEEEELDRRPGSTWFESYNRTHPWREPLRQRHIQEVRDRPLNVIHAESDVESRGKTVSSGLVRFSLQEVLEMRRPEFISHSRERMKRLALQTEERRLQAIFSRERDPLFSQPGGTGRLPKLAGRTEYRRAVPRKEMIQRSKQIYENLPEVQRRREEERRKVEYRSYRLNAQLYNKKITNYVLGRRTPWQ